jgi:DNA-binding MarR family transcriptional regulator
MSLFLSDMLHGRLPTCAPNNKGRLVSFSFSDADVRLTMGTMRERVLGYLYLNGGPSIARDIASTITSNPSRVIKTLKTLVEDGHVIDIKCKGCVTEYILTEQGSKFIKTSPAFSQLKS